MLGSLSVALNVNSACRSDNNLDRTSIYVLECSLSLLTKLESLSLKCVRFIVQKIYDCFYDFNVSVSQRTSFLRGVVRTSFCIRVFEVAMCKRGPCSFDEKVAVPSGFGAEECE